MSAMRSVRRRDGQSADGDVDRKHEPCAKTAVAQRLLPSLSGGPWK